MYVCMYTKKQQRRECYNYIAQRRRENKTLYPLGHSSSYCSNAVDIRLQTWFVISAAPKKKDVSSLKSDFVFHFSWQQKQRKIGGIQEQVGDMMFHFLHASRRD